MNHRPRKRFGQHFLTDTTVLDAIVASIAPAPTDHLVEIGPGQGALTARLLRTGARVDAIEIDRDLVALLRARFTAEPRLTIYSADALTFAYAALPAGPGKLRIVGNLPYNISTPLVLRLIQRLENVGDMCFMVQKEVADRFSAGPGEAAYGRLAVMLQSHCEVAQLFDVGPSAFDPPPKVESTVVLLRPLPHRPTAVEFERLEAVVARAFSQRRKMLRHTLGRDYPASELAALGISLQQRAEALSVAQYRALAQAEPDADPRLT